MSGPFAGAVMMTFFAPARQMLRRIVAVGEEPGGLEHEIDAEILPRKSRRISDRQDLEVVTIDLDAVVAGFDGGVEIAKNRIVL